MSLEELLLEDKPDRIEAMSDAELTSYLSPFFPITRPTPEMHKESKIIGPKSKQATMELNLKFKRAQALAKKFGIEL